MMQAGSGDSLQAQVDCGRRGHVRGEAIDRECPSIEDGEVGPPKSGKLLVSRSDEHVVHEQGMVCSC